MGIFEQLGGGQQNPMQLMRQLRANPLQFLQQAGLSVPQGMLGNPQAIVQHLVQTGQISQGKLAQAQQMAARIMGRR